MNKLVRITSLFEEGKIVEMGVDPETGTPVVVWVSKPNTFEAADARDDGFAAKAVRIASLRDDESPEMVNLYDQVSKDDFETLVGRALSVHQMEDYGSAVDDVRTDEKWNGAQERLARQTEILQAQGVPEDDPRWVTLTEEFSAFLKAVGEATEKRQEGRRKEYEGMDRDALIGMIADDFKDQMGMDSFIGAQRETLIYYCLRDCEATRDGDNWDHSRCDHTQRILDSRAGVRDLPERVLMLVNEALSEVQYGPVAVGNSDAPTPSSGSSEQPVAQEG